MCILHITSITGAKIQPECIEANLGNGTSYLQADSNEGKIHFWNATGKMLQTYDLLSNTTRLITHTGNNVTGLFYDWIADDLYWSESDTGLIKVAALKEATVEVTNIFTQLSNPKSLTGNPHKYELYWISGNSSSGSMAILRGSFNGTDVKQVINSSNGIGSPIALVFDEVRHRLYWLDNDRVRSVNTNGTDAEQHIRLTGANTFLIYKDYFIWRVGRNEIRAAFLDSSNAPVRIDLTVHGNVTGLCVFDSRIQRKERGPCEEDNGQCEHICLPSESGPVCRCKIGYRIAPDGKSCKSGTVCDTSAIKIQNGRVKDGCTGAIGEMCDYECDKDFTKTSLLKRFTCTKNGIWDTDFMGFCRKIECDRDMLFQPGRLSVECEVFGGKICNYTCNEGYENSRISCFSNGTWNNSLSAMCKEIYEKNAPNSPQASKAGLIGATIGGIIVVILVAVIIITVICFIRIRRRKLSEQGVYKNNPNVPFPNQNLRNNPYEVFDNPPEPDRSNDGSIQFANPLTGIEQPPNNIYSESSNQPNLSIEGATGRGVQFSNPLCFVDDVYVSVSD